MTMTMFYKREETKPGPDSPYRRLSIEHCRDWHVRVSSATKWGPAEEVKIISANTLQEAEELYSEMSKQLLQEGWKAYSDQEPW